MSTVDAKIIQSLVEYANTNNNWPSTTLFDSVEVVDSITRVLVDGDDIIVNWTNKSQDSDQGKFILGDVIYLHNKSTNEEEMYVCYGKTHHPTFASGKLYKFANVKQPNIIIDVDWHGGNDEYQIKGISSTHEIKEERRFVYRLKITEEPTLENGRIQIPHRSVYVPCHIFGFHEYIAEYRDLGTTI